MVFSAIHRGELIRCRHLTLGAVRYNLLQFFFLFVLTRTAETDKDKNFFKFIGRDLAKAVFSEFYPVSMNISLDIVDFKVQSWMNTTAFTEIMCAYQTNTYTQLSRSFGGKMRSCIFSRYERKTTQQNLLQHCYWNNKRCLMNGSHRFFTTLFLPFLLFFL